MAVSSVSKRMYSLRASGYRNSLQGEYNPSQVAFRAPYLAPTSGFSNISISKTTSQTILRSRPLGNK